MPVDIPNGRQGIQFRPVPVNIVTSPGRYPEVQPARSEEPMDVDLSPEAPMGADLPTTPAAEIPAFRTVGNLPNM